MTMTEGALDRTKMEGMIATASNVLDRALDPKTNGVPKELFEKCKGIVLLSAIEAGFVFTGNVGTGILMAKKDDGSWSVPSALGLTGVGWGFVAGGSVKDIMIFVMDQRTLEAIAGDNGLKFGGQAELTIANFGRSYNGSVNVSTAGATGGTVSVAFSKGLFVGVSIEGAVVGARKAVNEAFYNTNASALQLIVDGNVTMPEGTKIDEVYKKLDMLKEGKIADETKEG